MALYRLMKRIKYTKKYTSLIVPNIIKLFDIHYKFSKIFYLMLE
jgi:hypothetical protein